MAKEFTDGNFDQEVLQSDKITVVDFWAPWCGPCRKIAPIIDQLSTELEGQVNVGKMNVDHNSVAAKYRVRSIPTILFFKNGQVVAKQIGLTSKQGILDKIDEAAAAVIEA